MMVSLKALKCGMCIAEDVVNDKGMLIVAKDTIVTDNIISRLQLYNINEIRIAKKGAPIKRNAYKETEDFQKYYKESKVVKDSLNNSFNKILNDASDDNEIRDVLNMSVNMFDRNKSNSNLVDILYTMQEFSDTTYLHCINVAMIAGLLGKWLSWNEQDINMLVMCGLFHDIGKLTIPDSILHKPGRLTDAEYKLMKQHTTLGYNKLKDMKSLPPEVKRTALLHHERNDGTGYPLGLRGEKIDKFSKVIAIADVYDALTANRVYRDAMCPFDVIAILEKEGLGMYETRYIMTFLHRLLYSFLNKKVYLNNGMVAQIKDINMEARSKPVVVMESGKVIDLSQYNEIKIESIVE